MTLTLRLLGSPEAERDGVPIQVDTRKAVALLAYLAVTDRPHARDSLAGLMWPDADTERARAALRRTLSALNKALSGSWLQADRSVVVLRSDGIDSDLRRFTELLAAAGAADSGVAASVELLREAVALYRGDFLEGFALRDADPFDEWQFLQAEALRRQYGGALERLVVGLIELGEHQPAIPFARRWLALDPLHEPAHQQLIALYAAAGQRAAALRQYRECVRILDRELGVEPLAETTALYHAATNERPSAPQPTDRRRAVPVPVSRTTEGRGGRAWPLVGRVVERDLLRFAYATVGTEGRLCVVEGEAGIGKTRLAEDLLEQARAKGATCIAARCYEGETSLAYSPVVAALRQALSDAQAADRPAPHDLAEIARLLPELADGTPLPPLDSPGAHGRFLEAIGAVLTGSPTAATAPRVLYLDDVHWADEATMDVITFLARRLRARPLLLLLTWRTEQVPRDHRLRRVLSDAQRDQLGVVAVPRRLTASDVTALCAATAGVSGEQGLIERVQADTQGLPLLVVTYLAALAAGELNGDAVPGGVRNLLLASLGRVSQTALQALSAAAIIGRSCDADLVMLVSGRGDDETVAALEELVARGLLDESDGRYDFVHPLLRDLVYSETSLARRRLLHRRIGDALVSQARGPRDRAGQESRIAHHYRLAGREVEAAEHLLLAAQHAQSVGAHADALAHLEMAVALDHPRPDAVHEAMGDAHTLLGAYEGALHSYETAAALTDDRRRLVGLEHRLGLVHQRRGDWELADDHLQAAVAALGTGEAPLRARLLADRSLTAHRAGQPTQAAELAQQALAVAEESGEAAALAQAHNVASVLCRHRGDSARAREHGERSLQLGRALPDPRHRIAAANNLALVEAREGNHSRALEIAGGALEQCRAFGDRHQEAALLNNLADILHAAGRQEEAMTHLKQAVAIFAEVGEPGTPRPEVWKLVEW